MNPLSKSNVMSKNIVFVDGQPGCGKTMFSSLLSTFVNVEIPQYIFEIEYLMRCHTLGHLDLNTAMVLAGLGLDNKLYSAMMGRDVNFRFSDISSVFRNPRRFEYFKRCIRKGDECIPQVIESRNPIQCLISHDLLADSLPLLSDPNRTVTFIYAVRHPLYMLIQQTLNMKRLLNDSRDVQVYFKYGSHELPYFALGWEDLFVQSNDVDRAIYSMYYSHKKLTAFMCDQRLQSDKNILIVPFERFVRNPNEYLAKIEVAIGTKMTKLTKRYLKMHHVPRMVSSDGMPMKIYKRCGWKKPQSQSEHDELAIRRCYAVEMGASSKAIETLDVMSSEYAGQYMPELT